LLLQAALPQYESLFSEYVALAASQRREVDLSLALDPQRLLGPSHTPSHMLGGRSTHGGSGSSNLLTAAPHNAAAAAGAGAGSSSRGVQQQLQLPSAGAAAPQGRASAGGSGGGSGAAAGGGSGRRNSAHVVGFGQEVRAEDGSAVPQEVGVLSRDEESMWGFQLIHWPCSHCEPTGRAVLCLVEPKLKTCS
jgi:hypothetical protein